MFLILVAQSSSGYNHRWIVACPGPINQPLNHSTVHKYMQVCASMRKYVQVPASTRGSTSVRSLFVEVDVTRTRSEFENKVRQE